MRILRTGTLLALASGLSLIACNRTESVAPAAEPSSPETGLAPKDAAFARDAYAIKSGEKDPAKIKTALRELSQRYGYPVWPNELSSSGAAPEAAPGGVPGALGKAAAYSWPDVRNVDIIYHFAHSRDVSVPANATLRASAVQVDGGTDPMIIAFYAPGGFVSPEAYKVKFVGYNDDAAPGNVNSSFVWTNNTGAARSVRIVSWSYPGTTGRTTLSYKVDNPPQVFERGNFTMWVSGNTEVYVHTPAGYEGCTGPSLTKVQLDQAAGHPATGFGSALVAFNESTMDGAFIRDTEATLTLSHVLYQGGSSFLLGYFQGDGYQPNMDGSAAMVQKLQDHYQYPYYIAWQFDRYNCP